MQRFTLHLALLVTLTGCQAGLDKTSSLTMSSAEYQSRPPATTSLFATDEAVLSGASIEQILGSKVVIPKKARLAVLQFGHRDSWRWWSEDLSQLSQEVEASSITRLQRSARFADVSLLPALMVPEKKSVPYLREAAARYQADLLLVYQTSGRAYNRPKIIGPDEVKARQVVEAILLDVRTGIVPFASTSAQEFTAKKSKDDFNFSETIAKAELKAVGLGLTKVADDLARFVEAVP